MLTNKILNYYWIFNRSIESIVSLLLVKLLKMYVDACRGYLQSELRLKIITKLWHWASTGSLVTRYSAF